MKPPVFLTQRTFLPGAISLFLAVFAPLHAQKDDSKEAAIVEAREIDAVAAKQGDATASASLSADFSGFAGSTANANALVAGLRNGSKTTLTSPVNGPTQTTVFTPATSKQGYGNVAISLALARAELKNAGITSPTSDQMVAALNGGNVTVNGKTTTLSGVLALRASGMGWGQVAGSLKVNLGSIERSLRDERGHLERAEHTDKPDKAERAEKTDKPEKSERPALPDKVSLPDKPEIPDRPTRPDRPEKPERPVVPDRPPRG